MKYEDPDDTVDHWNEPHPGRATRRPALRSEKTRRGFSVARGIIVHHDSELEHHNALNILARRDVASIEAQYPRVPYRDTAGAWCTHTFDYFLTLKSSTRIAVAVKLDRKREFMEDLLDRIVAANGRKWFDKVWLVSELQGNYEIATNARQLVDSRKGLDESAVIELLVIVDGLTGLFRFGELLRNAANQPVRRAAVWRLLDLGVLEHVGEGRIDELSWLQRTEPRSTAPAAGGR